MIESWYYGKTKVSKKDLIVMTFIDKSANQMEVMVIGDDPKDITGLLAEVHRNLTDEFSRIGRLQNIYNISIKDSVVQRTNLMSFCDPDGKCSGDVTIEDSVVMRSNILSPNHENSDDGDIPQTTKKTTISIPQQRDFAGKCPKCGSDLVWRIAQKTGEKYRGCTNYDGGCRYQERSY